MAKINSGFDELLDSIQDSFKQQGVVSLGNFLMPSALADVLGLSWKVKYEPLKFSYSFAKGPSWKSELEVFLSKIVGKKLKFKVLEWRKFKHGDYTLLYDSLKEESGFVVMVDIVPREQEWGGYSSFISRSGEVARVVAEKNTLTLVNAKGLRHFVKRVNHHSKSPRIFLYGVLG
jgi:hypothetical protein